MTVHTVRVPPAEAVLFIHSIAKKKCSLSKAIVVFNMSLTATHICLRLSRPILIRFALGDFFLMQILLKLVFNVSPKIFVYNEKAKTVLL